MLCHWSVWGGCKLKVQTSILGNIFLQHKELVVRLVSVWGDLTAAFGLDAVKDRDLGLAGLSSAAL